MINSKDSPSVSKFSKPEQTPNSEKVVSKEKGPLSFISGSMTSGLLAWICLILSQKLVGYFMNHSPHYTSPIAQSAASGFKTLVLGTSFLATFSFAFIGLGLLLVFIRSLFGVNSSKES